MISDLNSLLLCLEKELINNKSSITASTSVIDELFKYTNSSSVVYWKDKLSQQTYLGLGVYKKIENVEEYSNNQEINNYHSFGAQYFESDKLISSLWEDFSPFHFIIPNYLFKHDADTNKLELLKYTNKQMPITSYFDFSQKESFKANELIEKKELPSKQDWKLAVSQLKTQLTEVFNKVVLSKMTTIKLANSIESKKIFLKNKNLMNNCHHFYMSPKEGVSFFSLTPETLYKKEDNNISIDAIAGTRSRGSSVEEDDKLGDELLSSSKDRDEHNIVINMITSAMKELGDITQGDTILLKLKNVQHLYTPIQITTKSKKSSLSFIDLLHPTPAVGGFPKEQAQKYIRENEPYERGFYAGPIGHISKDKEELAVGIRSALVKGNVAHIFGGCGLIKDSDAEAEWIEITQKTKYLIDSFYE